MRPILADGALASRRLVLSEVAPDLRERLGALGADAVEPGDATIDGLVHDAGRAFASGGPERLAESLAETWVRVRTSAVPAMTGDASARGGRIVLIAPSRDAGPLADAAAAGLESLARTLGVEWARFGVTAVALVPSRDPAVLAELVAYVLSSAGGYLSGTRISLGSPPGGARRATR